MLREQRAPARRLSQPKVIWDSNPYFRIYSYSDPDVYRIVAKNKKTTLESEYSKLRANYAGFPTVDEPVFDTELVSKIISNLKLGKATDIDGLTGEHLLHSHPILQVIISRREMMTFAKLI